MSKTGGGAAYQRLQKVGNYISDNANRAADRAAGNMRQQRAINAQEKARQEQRQQSAFDALELAPEDFQTTVTGFDTRDDIMRDYAQFNIEQFTEWGEKGREASLKGDEEGYREALNMQKKLKSNFNNIKNAEGALKELNDSFFKMANEGKISPVDEEYEKTMQAFAKNNVRIVNDENGIPYFEALLESDGEGENKYTRVRVSDFVNGSYRPYEVFNVDGEKGWVNTIASNMGLDTIKKADGTFYVRETKEWTPKNEAALSSSINGLLASDRVVSSILYQATGAKKKERFTQEEKDIVGDYLYKRVRGNVGESDERSWDSGRANYSLGAERNRIARENQQEEVETYEAELVTTPSGEVSKSLPVPTTGSASRFADTEEFTLKSKKGTPLRGIISDNAQAELLTLTRRGNEYYGNIRTVSDVTSKEGSSNDLFGSGNKSQKSKNTEFEVRKLTDTELNRVARAMGIDNASNLDKYLTERKNLKTQKSSPTTSGGASKFNK